LNPEKVKDIEEKGFEKVFQLTCPLVISNMMCFDSDNNLVKYGSPLDIIDAFYKVRLNFYIERRVGYNFFFGIYMHIFPS